jgi:hypothetical protein
VPPASPTEPAARTVVHAPVQTKTKQQQKGILKLDSNRAPLRFKAAHCVGLTRGAAQCVGHTRAGGPDTQEGWKTHVVARLRDLVDAAVEHDGLDGHVTGVPQQLHQRRGAIFPSACATRRLREANESACRHEPRCYTAMKKLRIVILGFGTARQKRVLERWTNPKPPNPFEIVPLSNFVPRDFGFVLG